MKALSTGFIAFALLVASVCLRQLTPSGSPVFAADAGVDYVRDVKPVLAKHCTSCHGAQKQRSGLRLDTAKAALEGGNSGPAIVPGKSAESLLYKAITACEGVKVMPPKESPRLSAEQVALLKAWIDQGA